MTDEIEKNKSAKEIGLENKAKVLDCYTEYVQEHDKAPTITELSTIVGLTRPVIYKHLRNLQLNEIGIKFKPRAISILEGVAKRAEQGDFQCAKLILNLCYGYSERKQVDITSTNKSIKVIFNTSDKDDIKKITDSVKETSYEEIDE